MSKYAQNTSVDEFRSKQEIEHILIRFGADQFISGTDVGLCMAFVQFRFDNRFYKIMLKLPDPSEFAQTPTGRARRNDNAQHTQWEQAVRQRWRELVLYIKGVLVASQSGIIDIRQAFMGYTLLPGGKTAGEYYEDHVAEAYLSGKMPKQLPGF